MPYQGEEDLPLPEKGTRADGTDTTHSTNRCDSDDGVIDNNVPKRDQTKPHVYNGPSSLNTARSSIKSRNISLIPSCETALCMTAAILVGSGLASIPWFMWGYNDQLPVKLDINEGSSVFCINLTATETPFKEAIQGSDFGLLHPIKVLPIPPGKVYWSWPGYVGCTELANPGTLHPGTITVTLGGQENPTTVSIHGDISTSFLNRI